MKHRLRLLALLVLVVLLASVEYWTLSHNLSQMFQSGSQAIWNFFASFDLELALAGMIVWIRTVGTKFLMIEVPKFMLRSRIRYIIIWMLPVKWHRFVRLRVARLFIAVRHSRSAVFAWLGKEHMFGPYATYALGIIVAGVLSVLSFTLFWVYLFLWLGFVQLPSFLGTILKFLWHRVLWAFEKMPFSTVVFTWGARVSEWVDDQIPQVRWTKTPEQKKEIARQRFHKTNLLRKKRRRLLKGLQKTKKRAKRTGSDKNDPSRQLIWWGLYYFFVESTLLFQGILVLCVTKLGGELVHWELTRTLSAKTVNLLNVLAIINGASHEFYVILSHKQQ